MTIPETKKGERADERGKARLEKIVGYKVSRVDKSRIRYRKAGEFGLMLITSPSARIANGCDVARILYVPKHSVLSAHRGFRRPIRRTREARWRICVQTHEIFRRALVAKHTRSTMATSRTKKTQQCVDQADDSRDSCLRDLPDC